MKIKVYIGAHKTATTHVQGILSANRSLLSSLNIQLSNPSDLRTEWLPLFFKTQAQTQSDNSKYHAQLRDISPQQGTWIFAEENFSGNAYEMMLHEPLYPNLAARLRQIKKVFKQAEIELYFSIRSYAYYFRSAYLEVVRNRGYIAFSDYYKASWYETKNWHELVSAMVSVFPEKNIHLWQYESLASLLPRLLKSLTSIQADEEIEALIARYKQRTTRPSLSAKAIEVLAIMSREQGRAVSLKELEQLHAHYPLGEQYGKFMPFSTKELARYETKYMHDIAAIKKDYPNIQFNFNKKPLEQK